MKIIYLLTLVSLITTNSISQVTDLPILVSKEKTPIRDTSIQLNAFSKRTKLVDVNGDIILDHFEVSKFNNGLAKIKQNGKYGFIDVNGVLVIPITYDFAFDFSENFCAVELNNEWFYINKLNQRIIQIPEIKNPQPFQNGYAKIKLPEGVTFVSKKGEFLFEPGTYKNCRSFFEERALVQSFDDKFGFIDTLGNEVIPLIYDQGNIFSSGLTPVKLKDKWGYIDKEGKTIIEFQFDDAGRFRSNRADVEIGDKEGYIDRIGNIVIPIEYDTAEPFDFRKKGLALVRMNGYEAFYIDINGKKIMPAGF